MKTGIIVAMGKELELLLGLIGDKQETLVGGYKFYEGTVGAHQIVAMQCGIGKVNAALGTSVMLDAFAPEFVVNTGVAGGTGIGASILDIVVADRITYHDVWCGPGTEWGEAAGCPRFFPCPLDASRIAAAIGGKHGLVASGDIFVSREEDVRRILHHFPDTMAVDMESGAIAQTCWLRGVRMLCVRVLSDTPGAADNISQYENFWTDAPCHTFSALRKVLEIIGEQE